MLEFLLGLLSIVCVNIMLSGDNALVIAMASRRLPPDKQKQAILWGSIGAIALRILLTMLAVVILKIPFLKLAGGLLLFWIALKLLAEEDHAGEDWEPNGGNTLLSAIKTIIVADLVMSLDNVLAVAGAAKGNLGLLVSGLVLSIPLIIFGSKLLSQLLHRFPWLVYFGAGLLGWIAGEMLASDVLLHAFIADSLADVEIVIPTVAALLVLMVGKWQNSRRQHEKMPEN